MSRYLWHKFQVNTINTTQCYYEISAAGKKDSSNHTRDQKSLGLIGLSLWAYFSTFSKVIPYTAWKVSKYGVFSGPYFPIFRLNTERCGLSLRIQSECGKIRTRKNSVFGHFSRSDSNPTYIIYSNLFQNFKWILFTITFDSFKSFCGFYWF